MAEMSWAYVAGFFDGEGTVGTSGTQVNPRYSQGGLSWQLAITQCDRNVLDEIAVFLYEHGIASTVYRHDYLTKFKRNKMVHTLRIRGGRKGIEAFCRGCMPYLRVKKAVSQDLLRIMKMFPRLNGKERKRTFLTPEQIEKMREGRRKLGHERISEIVKASWTTRRAGV